MLLGGKGELLAIVAVIDGKQFLYVGLERVWVSLENGVDVLLLQLRVVFIVVAGAADAVWPARLPFGEALAVQLEALGVLGVSTRVLIGAR